MGKKVLIVQKKMPIYRVKLFELLKNNLIEKGVILDVVYGDGKESEKKKNDDTTLSFGTKVPVNTYLQSLGGLFYQSLTHKIKEHNYDLIILEQANRDLLNYKLLIERYIGSVAKIAFWGHGVNKQIRTNSFFNTIKLQITKRVDWFFAYTNGVKKDLIQYGYEQDKITVLQNSIDTLQIKSDLEKISEMDLIDLKNEINLQDGPVGIFIGGMYEEKRISFLLKSIDSIQKGRPDFNFIFVGDGPDSELAYNYCQENERSYYLGTKFGTDKTKILKLADVILMPGLVGLVVLDSLTSGTPLITTDYPYHSPEIDYLNDKVNGIITPNNLNDYTEAVLNILNNPKFLEQLRVRGISDSKNYSIENMSENFANGIIKALE